MNSRRGEPTNRQAWPERGPLRDWLSYCDRIREDNGLPGLGDLAQRMGLPSATRVSDLLRGLSTPSDVRQARELLEALGAVGGEVDRGLGLFERAIAEPGRAASRPGWWLRSGYVEQVADIAPPQLLDRDAELDELAAWCAGGDDAYVWWQAGPRAGKSALMAWLVLHPPPETWVISFFVTARLAGQADSAAFTDALLDQLAAITGQQVPPLTSVAARDRLRRQLLDEAVARAGAEGKRLVLVVDGLDEDTGSGSASIAASLPGRASDGLRVIVCGRPGPQLPADVDPDHPIASCVIRRLDVSPHATRRTADAQRELDEVLTTDKHRQLGLGYQVLGLVAACGGGLDRRDLHQLTGRPAEEIDHLLSGVFGRTIAGRADPQAPDRVFLFTHETLRLETIEKLGPATLAGFAERLHGWAASYQSRGWPADTPAYLLRGYPRMLAEAGDLDRLVTLATDPARHHRMLNTTGGDAAALADIATAQSMIGGRRSPDLLAALRLAWYRDRLADRNTHLPTRLPAVWVALGQPVRAEQVARSITDPERQTEALAGLAGALATAVRYEQAEQVARSITDPDRREDALAGVAGSLSEAGRYTEAEQVARLITYPDRNAEVLAGLARALAAAGQLEQAEQVAVAAEQATRLIGDQDRQAKVSVGVAGALAAAGRADRGEQLARSISLSQQQAAALAGVAEALTAAGRYEEAERVAHTIANADRRAEVLTELVEALAAADRNDDAERVAGSIKDPESRVRALAAAGRPDLAERVARSIRDPNRQSEALARVAVALAAARRFADAERVAGSITGADARARALAAAGRRDRSMPASGFATNPYSWARNLGNEARALAAAGRRHEAAEVALDAERAAVAISDPVARAEVSAETAELLATAGRYDEAARVALEAERAARSIRNSEWRDAALAAVVGALVTARRAGQAERVARAIASPDQRERALAAVAGAPPAGPDDETRATRSVIDPDLEAEALTGLAEELLEEGRHEQAERAAIAAEEAARSIVDPDREAEALTGLARALVADGRPGPAERAAIAAEEAAAAITDPDRRARRLTGVAEALAAVGRYHEAEQVARSIAEPYARMRTLAVVAGAIAVRTDRAEHLARSVTDPYWEANALVNVARAMAASGRYDQAERVARSIGGYPDSRAEALTAVAAELAAAGRHDQARRMAGEAERAARSLTNPYARARLLTSVATVLIAAGRPVQAGQVAWSAGQVAASVTNPYSQARALAGVALALAAAGQDEEAGNVAWSARQAARAITNPYSLARTLAEVAAALAASGRVEEAERVARSITDPDRQEWALAAMAGALAGAGRSGLAERVARGITNPDRQATVLAELALAAEPGRAGPLIAGALAAGRWTIALPVLVRTDATALSVFVDECAPELGAAPAPAG
ncbi:hypothetical protein [Paractinoplanes globisporus]|uniref:Nephrocystin 3-like N-terminal domain-containing protein n=1 Tax=Paractinoplanes globisporus TaxID=113565 RepID=A0ABW6W509_9ACTN|nr:hypothetical protein [Actinoplanes globisporus]